MLMPEVAFRIMKLPFGLQRETSSIRCFDFHLTGRQMLLGIGRCETLRREQKVVHRSCKLSYHLAEQ